MDNTTTRTRTRGRFSPCRGWLTGLLATLALWVQALTICPQCAHEQADTANFCTHCGAALGAAVRSRPGPLPAPAADSAPDGAAESEGPHIEAPDGADKMQLVRDAVVADVHLARELLAAGRADVARAVFANALALSAVAPDALTPQQGEQLMSDIEQCEQMLTRAAMPCPACQGSGNRSLRFDTLTGESSSVAVTGQSCLTCRGSGQIRRNRSVDDLKYVIGQASRQAGQSLRSRGRVPVGNAWIPPALRPLLEIPDEARLRHAAAAPCVECQGIGRRDCARCGNTGFVPCTARGCDQGWVIRENLNVLDPRTDLRRRERCGTCGGSARVPCTDCRGAGALTCRVCNGSGKRSTCTPCGGDGTETCRICRGEGRNRDGTMCGECNGGGVALCRMCRGEGYRNR